MIIRFVNPPIRPFRKIMRGFDCATESKGNYLYQPYDFLLMSAKIPAEWDFALIDAVARPRDVSAVLGELKDPVPDIVVLALADTNWSQDFAFLRKLREDLPGSVLLVCGDSFEEAVACEEVSGACDGIIDNPLDVDFAGIWRAREEGKLQRAGLGLRESARRTAGLKAPRAVRIGIPRHASFMEDAYRWPFARHFRYSTIFTAWGCPHSCSYCIESGFPNLWRSAEEVLEEMRHVYELGIRELYIGDRSFGVPRENCLRILGEMTRRKLGFSWSSYFHPNQYDPELLEAMAASGCHTLIVGIESSNTENLARYGRKIRKGKQESLLDHCRRLGIEVCGDFIIGLPGDSRSDIEKTIQLSRRLSIQYASFNVATPLPGSSLRREAVRRGILAPNERHFDSFGRSRVLDSDHLDGDTIRMLRNRAIRKFYLRPRYLLQRLASVRGVQHLLIQLGEAFQLLAKSI